MDRIHIAIFGRRNAGKSSLINAFTGQDLAVVSEVRGTTTDPVWKTMELLPLGPVVIIDTPGYDDDGILGDLRVKKTRQVMNRADIAMLVLEGDEIAGEDRVILDLLAEKKIPSVVVHNKSDITGRSGARKDNEIWVSAKTGDGIRDLKEMVGHLVPQDSARPLVSDLVAPGDVLVLVTPIDAAAPKGRLILPQQQVLRDALEHGVISIVVRETELADALAKFGKSVSLVVTDSQAFEMVANIVPQEIRLTSFSILMARFKGNLQQAMGSAGALDDLKPGDAILVAEGCTHHRQCGDIGTVKLPAWIRKHSGVEDLKFEFVSGGEFPEDLTPYKMVVHCGGCMLNEKEMQYRAKCSADQNVPFLNYGMAIAKMKGIMDRCSGIFQ